MVFSVADKTKHNQHQKKELVFLKERRCSASWGLLLWDNNLSWKKIKRFSILRFVFFFQFNFLCEFFRFMLNYTNQAGRVKREHPKGAPFCECVERALYGLRPTIPPKQKHTAPPWFSGWPPRPAMAFSRDRGRGPVGSKEQLPFTLFMENKSCSRKLEVRIP